jgi:hypothetical protein
MRLRPRPDRARDLTPGQHEALTGGFALGNGIGFDSRTAMEAAYWAHREELLKESRLFSRPYAYWSFEADYIPQANETEKAALLRLGLPLTAQEQSILAKEKTTTV